MSFKILSYNNLNIVKTILFYIDDDLIRNRSD